jgi:hypothetical protein
MKVNLLGCFLLLFLFSSINAKAQEQLLPAQEMIDLTLAVTHVSQPTYKTEYQFSNYSVSYQTPKKWSFITQLPRDLADIAKVSFNKKSLKANAIVIGSTALLIPLDQQLINGAKKFASNINVKPETSYNEVLKIGEVKIFRLPRNLNTALYQAGQGFTSMLLAGGLYGYGKIAKDYRSVSVAGQLTESFVLMAICTQVLKRITGRESPFVATKPGGTWRPFPSFKKYQEDTPVYDAMPSGHLATLMSTITILTNNYPEKRWIKPVGFGLIGLTAFAMMNTEVHWAGDYPIALGLGYVCGKVVSSRYVKKQNRKLVSVLP